MKTLKVMSIISLVITALTAIAFYTPEDVVSTDSAWGWASILLLWTIAFSIVTLVQALKNKE